MDNDCKKCAKIGCDAQGSCEGWAPMLCTCQNCRYGKDGPTCYNWAGPAKIIEIQPMGYCVNWEGLYTAAGPDFFNMTLYKKDVRRTVPEDMTFNEGLGFAALGLGAEVGELQNTIKKSIHQGHDLDIEGVTEELGDAFFYIAALMDKLSITLTDVLAVNITKRQKRYPNGFTPEDSINNRGLK